MKVRKTILTTMSATLMTVMSSQPTLSAPLTLPTAPLILSSIVEPNVFFTLDDSGSMDNVFLSKVIYSDAQARTGGIPTDVGQPLDDTGFWIGYFHPTWPNIYGDRALPPTNGTEASFEKYWVFRNHHGNQLYYNSAITYSPWAGTNADGSAMYEDADPKSAPREPTAPGVNLVDLTERLDYYDPIGLVPYSRALFLPTFFTWQDDGDGIIETDDNRTMYEIKRGQSFPSGRSYADELQNFANWFVYHRSRMNAAKASLGQVINNAEGMRMGMDLFNQTLPLKVLQTMADPANKRALLQYFYSLIIPVAGTPARLSLKRTGDYFASNTSDAILSSDKGGECQQNFNILLSDGFWSGTSPGVGNTDQDGPGVFDGNALQSIDGGKYDDTQTNTLADVAMYNYERDLRPDLADRVPTEGADKASHQHLVNYSISFGLNGNSFGPGNAFNASNTDPAALAGFSWPNVNTDAGKVDDLWHAAYNGRGKYLNAEDPSELEKALKSTLASIATGTSTAAAASINSAKLTTNSVIYLANFNTNGWQGDLQAFKILADPATGALSTTGELSPTAEWEAGAVLNSRDITLNPRVILTHDSNASVSGGILQDGIPFQWDSLNTAQQNDLRTNSFGSLEAYSGTTPAYPIAEAKLNFLRGDRSNEGTGINLRVRTSLLGDMVNSAPVFVGAPGLSWPDVAPFPTTTGQRYSDFKKGSAKSRPAVIYAGSNDGMLHGFSETGGHEVLAYIPENLFSDSIVGEGLHYLTEESYQHRFYNDLTPAISDIYTNLGSGEAWQSILIGGQRGGGRGIYALDVTDPTKFTEANAAKLVLWEFTNADDPDLGYTYSQPKIAMSNDSNNSWVAIFGNGYNNTGDGQAKLFILTINKGIDGSWTAGDYREISTGSGTKGTPNGLGTPALADLDGNGTVDRAYAGDLKGQMWAFDLSGATQTSWTLANSSTAPLFTTIGGQAITAEPTLSQHPIIATTDTNNPNLMVFFGSGQYLTNADKNDLTDNHFYSVWDKGNNSRTASHLVEQTYDLAFTQRVLTRNEVNYAGGEYGWYFRLNKIDPQNPLEDQGERSVTKPAVRGGAVFFNSFIPSSGPCSVGGYGYRFAVDLATGGSLTDVEVDSNGDGEFNDDDKTTSSDGAGQAVIAAIRQEGYLPEPVFLEGSDGGAGSLSGDDNDAGIRGDCVGSVAFAGGQGLAIKCLASLPVGRFSWQELVQ